MKTRIELWQRVWVVGIAMGFGAPHSCQATDQSPASLPAQKAEFTFVLPPMTLGGDRTVEPPEQGPVSRPALTEPKATFSDTHPLGFYDLDGRPGNLSPLQYRRLDSFAQSLPRSSESSGDGGFLQRAGQVVFPEPVSIRVGRLDLGGGLITAIHRRNPFALLFFVDFFHVSF